MHDLGVAMMPQNLRRRHTEALDQASHGRALVQTMTPEEVDRARHAMGLIEQRGLNRKRNLSYEFDRFLRDRSLND